MRYLAVLALGLLLASVSVLRYAQAVNFAPMQGRVTDSTAAVVPGVKIQVTQTTAVITGSVRRFRQLGAWPLLAPCPHALNARVRLKNPWRESDE